MCRMNEPLGGKGDWMKHTARRRCLAHPPAGRSIGLRQQRGEYYQMVMRQMEASHQEEALLR